MLGAPPPAQPPDALARDVLLKAANRGEAFISLVRAVFCALILLRYVSLARSAPRFWGPAAGLELGALLLGILGSLWMLRRARRSTLGPNAFVVSALADAVICFLSLLSTVVGPDPDHQGVLQMPDPAAFVAVVSVGSLRLTPIATWLGTIASLGLLGALVGIDVLLHPQLRHDLSVLWLLGLFVVGIGVVASFTCSVARKLVVEAAVASSQASRASWRLGELLRDHHDVRTILSAAQLRTQLLSRELSPTGTGHVAGALLEDLKELGRIVHQVRTQALEEVWALGVPQSVQLQPVLTRCVQTTAHRFPDTEWILEGPPPDLGVQVLGGERGLQHLVSNVLINACEGDGRRGARRVRVTVASQPSGALLRVVDDGPGFADSALLNGRPTGGSTKTEGSGLGLAFVEALLTAGGGRLVLANESAGGACMELHLPGTRAPVPAAANA